LKFLELALELNQLLISVNPVKPEIIGFYNEKDQRNQLLKRHKATEQACEIRPHHLSIVQMANKREMEVRN
jgi:hypothetical protein